MNGARALALTLLCVAAACAGRAPRPEREPSPPKSPRPAPLPALPEPSARPAEPDAAPAAEEPDSSACKPRGPALELRLCNESRLAGELRKLEGSDGEYEGFVRCQPLSVEDLEPVEAREGRAGDTELGPGVFGDHDVNADGKPDVVRLYTSVDFWVWFVFVRERDCLRFVAAVDGYQVELRPGKHKGLRDVRVLPYPLQSSVETRVFDGKAYVKR